MQISRRSRQNMAIADSWDVWPLNPGPGAMLAVFRNGYSSVLNGPGSSGPAIFPTESAAVAFAVENLPGRPRRCRKRRGSASAAQKQHPKPVTTLD